MQDLDRRLSNPNGRTPPLPRGTKRKAGSNVEQQNEKESKSVSLHSKGARATFEKYPEWLYAVNKFIDLAGHPTSPPPHVELNPF